MSEQSPHESVLAQELVEMVAPEPGQTIIDGTFGAGGHAGLVAAKLGSSGNLVVVDRDPVALAIAEEFAASVQCSVRVIAKPFAEALQMLSQEGFTADAAYFDFGMSSMQIDEPERGFSYVHDAPLDMRMGGEAQISAAEVLASWQEEELAQAFQRYGEEKFSRRIASEIVRRRQETPITTTAQLSELIASTIPPAVRFKGGHPAKRVFQALRIVVNDELRQIEEALPAAWGLLSDGGRLAAISFHSLEDRPTKQFFAELAQGCVCPPEIPVCLCGKTPQAEMLSRKAIKPTQEEMQRNPRSRSARLRAAKKLAATEV